MAVQKKTGDSVSVASNRSAKSTKSSHLDKAKEIRQQQEAAEQEKAALLRENEDRSSLVLEELREKEAERQQNLKAKNAERMAVVQKSSAEIKLEEERFGEQILNQANTKQKAAAVKRAEQIDQIAEPAAVHNKHVAEVVAKFRNGQIPSPDRATPKSGKKDSASKSPKGKGKSNLHEATANIAEDALEEVAIISRDLLGGGEENTEEIQQQLEREFVEAEQATTFPTEVDDEEQYEEDFHTPDEGLDQERKAQVNPNIEQATILPTEGNDDERYEEDFEEEDELTVEEEIDQNEFQETDSKGLEEAKRAEEIAARKLFSTESATIKPVQRPLSEQERNDRNQKMADMKITEEDAEEENDLDEENKEKEIVAGELQQNRTSSLPPITQGAIRIGGDPLRPENYDDRELGERIIQRFTDDLNRKETVVSESQPNGRTSSLPPITQGATRMGRDPLRAENYDDQQFGKEIIQQYQDGLNRVDIEEEEQQQDILDEKPLDLSQENSDQMDQESEEILDQVPNSLLQNTVSLEDENSVPQEKDLEVENLEENTVDETVDIEEQQRQRDAKEKELQEAKQKITEQVTSQTAHSFASSIIGSQFTPEKLAARFNASEQGEQQNKENGFGELNDVVREMVPTELYRGDSRPAEVQKALTKEQKMARNQKFNMGDIAEVDEEMAEENDLEEQERIEETAAPRKPSDIYRGINDIILNEEIDLEEKQLEIAKLASECKDDAIQIYAIAASSIISHDKSEEKDKDHSLKRLQEEFSFLANDEQNPQEREESIKAASANLQSDGEIIDGHKELIAGAFNSVLKVQEIEKQKEIEKKKAKENQDNQQPESTTTKPSDASKEADEFKKYCDELLKKYGDRYKLDLKSSGLQMARILATVAIAVAIPGVGAVLAGAFFMATKNHAKDEKMPNGRNTDLEEAMNMLKGADIKTAEAQKMLDKVKNSKTKGEQKTPASSKGGDELEGVMDGLTGNIAEGGRSGSTTTRSSTIQKELEEEQSR